VVYVIFDRVNFTLSAVNERVDVGKEASITVSAVYAYDGSTFEGTYSLNDTLTKSEVGKYGFKVASMTDTLYGFLKVQVGDLRRQHRPFEGYSLNF